MQKPHQCRAIAVLLHFQIQLHSTQCWLPMTSSMMTWLNQFPSMWFWSMMEMGEHVHSDYLCLTLQWGSRSGNVLKTTGSLTMLCCDCALLYLFACLDRLFSLLRSAILWNAPPFLSHLFEFVWHLVHSGRARKFTLVHKMGDATGLTVCVGNEFHVELSLIHLKSIVLIISKQCRSFMKAHKSHDKTWNWYYFNESVW